MLLATNNGNLTASYLQLRDNGRRVNRSGLRDIEINGRRMTVSTDDPRRSDPITSRRRFLESRQRQPHFPDRTGG